MRRAQRYPARPGSSSADPVADQQQQQQPLPSQAFTAYPLPTADQPQQAPMQLPQVPTPVQTAQPFFQPVQQVSIPAQPIPPNIQQPMLPAQSSSLTAPSQPPVLQPPTSYSGPINPHDFVADTAAAEAVLHNPLIRRSEGLLQFTSDAMLSTQAEFNRYGLPIGFHLQGLRDGEDNACKIINPLTDFNINPIRCNECRAFLNCYCLISPDRSAFRCNFCGGTTPLDPRYGAELATDAAPVVPVAGTRSQITLSNSTNPNQNVQIGRNRIELSHEAFEIDPPCQYNAHTGGGDTFEAIIFVVDVSPLAVASGLTETVCEGIRRVLRRARADAEERRVRSMYGIVCFNTQVHYVVVRDNVRFVIFTSPEIDVVNVPAPRDIVVSITARGECLQNALDAIPKFFARQNSCPNAASSTQSTGSPKDVCFGAALEASFTCLSSIGGKVVYFLSHIPSCGLGSLHTDAVKRFGALQRKEHFDAVKTVLTPKGNEANYYTDLAVRASVNFVSCDGFVCPSVQQDFLEPASLLEICRLTSGRYHYFPEFSRLRDHTALTDAIERVYTRYSVIEGCVRVRTSAELATKYYYGHCYLRQEGLVQLAHLDEDMCVSGEFGINETIKVPLVFFQVSLLYTTKANQRRIRVVTRGLPVLPPRQQTGESLLFFIRGVRLGEQVALIAKKVSAAMRSNSEVYSVTNSCAVMEPSNEIISVQGCMASGANFSTTVHGLYADFVTFLHTWKLFGGQAGPNIVETLPKHLAMLPLMVFATRKVHLCRPVTQRTLALEERVYCMSRLDYGNVDSVLRVVYPSICEIAFGAAPDAEEAAGRPGVWRAVPGRLSSEYIKQNGIYVIEDVHSIYVYLNPSVDVRLIAQLTGVGNPDLRGPLPLNTDGNELTTCVLDTCEAIKSKRKENLAVYVLSAMSKLVGPIMHCLIENKLDGESYPEFVRCCVHAVASRK